MNEEQSGYDWRQRPVESLKGVGSEMAEKLARLDIFTAGDLINHFPRKHEDFSKIIKIRDMRPGPVTFRGQIERVASRYARARKLNITEAIIADDTGTVKAIWFNQSYLAKSLPVGSPVLVSGELKFRNNDLAMQSPTIEVEKEGQQSKDAARIVPIYPETEGLSSRQLRGLILPLLPLVSTTPDPLPPEVVESAELMPHAEALAQIHFPTDMNVLERAHHRLAFDELWPMVMASLALKNELAADPEAAVQFRAEVAKATVAALGFELTPGQKMAAWEILRNMADEKPMNRLLQGDVGSGKTAVALMAAVMALASGRQAALMVPTEVLARQHAARLSPLLHGLGYETVLLLGGQPTAERKAVLARMASGEPLLAVGTQAMLTESANFADLALAIVDEQHRFGVEQRRLLKAKSGRLPHLLTMTATPIPRSLQLTVYGDLDISVIGDLPPGRQPVITKVVELTKRDETYQLINEQIAAGRQVFIVCPLIEESETLEVRNVTTELERLQKGPLAGRRLALMHGRLSSAEKQEVMERFAAGEIDALVTTTVIEVGVDIPNATVMLVEGAERFGLAALHQLRGRVGRGADAAYCLLAATTKGAGAERLRALERCHDGFRLAQIDLEQRGPGQIYGRRQHGDLDLRLADITDAKLLSLVRREAERFLSDPALMLKYPHVMARIAALQAVTSLD